jgi:hypothetical protein
MGRKNAKIDEPGLARLNELKRLVKAEFGLRARQEDIVSALVLDATVGHVVGTLLAYEKSKPEDPDDDQEDESGPREANEDT